MIQPAVRDQDAALGHDNPKSMKLPLAIAALGIGLAVICLMFLREIRSAIEVWNTSTAYSHCYLVLPMALYLLWERRELIAANPIAPDLRFVFAAVPLTVCWLIAERLGIMEARQLVVVSGVLLLFLTIFGVKLFRSMLGPLLFLFFLVPFGAFLTPALQQFTATFSIVGLDLLGIPNFSDKFTIETPAGIFFVAEACAGLRFLIAAIAFGVFYSLLSYTSPTRRIAFIAASIIVPIIANGFRALGIVVLGQVLGSAEAAAADHLIYGWIFFSIVMLLLIMGGHAFREAAQPAEMEVASASTLPARSPFWAMAIVMVLLAIGPGLAAAIDSTAVLPVLPQMTTITAPDGCSLSEKSAENVAGRRSFAVSCGREQFEVRVEAFAARSTASGMIAERRRVTREIGAENAAVSTVELPAGAGYWTIVQTTDPNRVTAFASWVDGAPVPSSLAGRIAQARDSIVGTTYAPTLITVTTAEPANSSPGQRKATLERLTSLLRDQRDLNSRMAAMTRLKS